MFLNQTGIASFFLILRFTGKIWILLVFVILGCSQEPFIDANSIIDQLPDNKRKVILPDKLALQITDNARVISFSYMDSIQSSEGKIYNESEFYTKARELGIQYIVISSTMTYDSTHNFPWISNRNFRVCPGNVEHTSDTFYTLLLWDNTNNKYHFFKYLYEGE